MNGPCRAHHVVSTEKIFSSVTFFIFVQIGNVNSNRRRCTRSFFCTFRSIVMQTCLMKLLTRRVILISREIIRWKIYCTYM